MVSQPDKKLVPRSFLPTRALDRVLNKEAVRRGMKMSALVRQALKEWLLYQGNKEARRLDQQGKL